MNDTRINGRDEERESVGGKVGRQTSRAGRRNSANADNCIAMYSDIPLNYLRVVLGHSWRASDGRLLTYL